MAIPRSSRDVILVKCQEVPETICIETIFITQSCKQKNNEQILFSNNGTLELHKDGQAASAKILQSDPKTSMLNVNIKPKLVSTRSNTITSTTVQQCQLSQHAQPHAVPINFNNNGLSSTQRDNTSQLKLLNNEVLPAPQLATCNDLNISNISVRFSEQIQQTDISAFNTKSIAIQCKLDDEFEDFDVECPVTNEDFCENSEDTKNEMESFLNFIKKNSIQHKNFKECLICGEICRYNKYFYGHMAIHRGPKVLCFKCGQYSEHGNLLPQHKCQKAKKLAKAFLKCPHFSCDVAGISLIELFDHINEHTNNRIYKCSACLKGFCTAQEYLRHIRIRARCYASAKRKRFRLYGLKSQRDLHCRVRVFKLYTYKKCTTLVKTFLSHRTPKKGICKVCLKSFRNKYIYNRHHPICIARFRKRLIKKIKI